MFVSRGPRVTQEGHGLRNILGRTLQRMSQSETSDNLADKRVYDIFSAMNEAHVHGDDDDDDTSHSALQDTSWMQFLKESVDEEVSFAALNRKRRLLTFAAFRNEQQLMTQITTLESLLKPNCHRMHLLFERTRVISELLKTKTMSQERERLRQRFLDY